MTSFYQHNDANVTILKSIDFSFSMNNIEEMIFTSIFNHDLFWKKDNYSLNSPLKTGV